MSLNVNSAPKSTKSKSDPVEIGNYAARIVQVLDLGLQPQQPFQGNPKAPAHEIMLTYELVTEFLKDDEGNDQLDKPRWLSENFPLNHISKDMAKSTKRYKAIDPANVAGGDFTKLVNAPLTVTVVHRPKPDGGVYVNVGNITPPMKGFPVPELVNPPKVFELDNPDLATFRDLPEWIQTKITSNLEYQGSKLQALLKGAPGKPQEDVPQAQPEAEAAETAKEGDIPW